MPSFNRNWTEKKIARYIKEKRGTGEGPNYIPWVTVYDAPGGTNVFRIMGHKTGREHHLFSASEADVFYILDISPMIEDIREQHPMLPQAETIAIANACGIRYPRDPKTKVPIVMTSDFLVVVRRNGKLVIEVWTYKPADLLERPRVQAKFEIERRYWERRNVPWRMLTDRDISPTLRQNARWLHGYLSPSDLGLNDADFTFLARKLTELVHDRPHENLAALCIEIDAQLGLALGVTLGVARNLMGTGLWLVDLTLPIVPARPISLKGVTGSLRGEPA